MLLLLSYLIAVAAFILPMRSSSSMADHFSFVLSAIWAVAAIYGFTKADRRMTRVMLGLPLVLFWPALNMIATAICRLGDDCL